MLTEATKAILTRQAPEDCPRVTGDEASDYQRDFSKARYSPQHDWLFVMSCNGATMSPRYSGKALPVYNQFGHANEGDPHPACANCPLKVGNNRSEVYRLTGEIF